MLRTIIRKEFKGIIINLLYRWWLTLVNNWSGRNNDDIIIIFMIVNNVMVGGYEVGCVAEAVQAVVFLADVKLLGERFLWLSQKHI